MNSIRRAILAASFLVFGCLSFNSQAEQVLVVSAAASLKDVFNEAGKIFEQENPGTKVAFNFSGSSQLAGQIDQGAPVDVFVSADMSHINRLAGKGLIAESSIVAQNKLAIIVSKVSPEKIETLEDLSKKGLRLIMAAKQVPVAVYALQFLKKVDQAGIYGADFSSKVLRNTISEEPDVRMVAMKVAMGEGDVGIVYVSDVTGDIKNKIKTIAIADQFNVIADYGIAIVKGTSHPAAAKAFYGFIRSARGQALLAKGGLLPAASK